MVDFSKRSRDDYSEAKENKVSMMNILRNASIERKEGRWFLNSMLKAFLNWVLLKNFRFF